MTLPNAQQLFAISQIISASAAPLGVIISGWIAWRQHRIKRMVNGRLEELVRVTRENALKEGAMRVLMAGQAPNEAAKDIVAAHD